MASSMISQVALNPRLNDPFAFYELKPTDVLQPKPSLTQAIQQDFESGKIIVIEGFHPENLQFFLDIPAAIFPEWVPPVEDHRILSQPVNEQHPFWEFYPDKERITHFQEKMQPFQKSWEDFHSRLFPNYDFTAQYWSWRMNQMELGYLHLDIPPGYKEHQQRAFMNLSRRARVLEVGPTLESLIAHFYDSENLAQYRNLGVKDYFTEIKKHLFKNLHLDEHYLPRHTLRLSPGAIWISHSSIITHGIVFGEKTVCLETRIPPAQIANKENEFSSILDRVKSNSMINPEPIDMYL